MHGTRAKWLIAAVCGTCIWGCQNGATVAHTQGSKAAVDDLPHPLPHDKSVFHDLLENHAAIRRTVHEIPGGVVAVTESDDPQVAALLQDHIASMKARIEGGYRVRQWDPLYVKMFDHADKLRVSFEKTPKGIKVTETSDDPYVVQLIREHAKVVSGFAARGFEESEKAHPAPAPAQ